jgi:FkbM family methyltransferase
MQRVKIKQMRGIDPIVAKTLSVPLERHGNSYCGWKIPTGFLGRNAIVVDVGLGEDISFSQSLMNIYGCEVHGFDPTPRSIEFVEKLGLDKFHLHAFGLAEHSGTRKFYLPADQSYVSGAITKQENSGDRQLDVEVLTLDDVFDIVDCQFIDVLKMDIEGAEYEVILGKAFADKAPFIKILAVEFHHRWSIYGKSQTDVAVQRLRQLGFECCWCNLETNEEFTFVNTMLAVSMKQNGVKIK